MERLKPQYIVVKAVKLILKGKNKSVSGKYIMRLDEDVMNKILKDADNACSNRMK